MEDQKGTVEEPAPKGAGGPRLREVTAEKSNRYCGESGVAKHSLTPLSGSQLHVDLYDADAAMVTELWLGHGMTCGTIMIAV